MQIGGMWVCDEGGSSVGQDPRVKFPAGDCTCTHVCVRRFYALLKVLTCTNRPASEIWPCMTVFTRACVSGVAVCSCLNVVG